MKNSHRLAVVKRLSSSRAGWAGFSNTASAISAGTGEAPSRDKSIYPHQQIQNFADNKKMQMPFIWFRILISVKPDLF
jgi:hypothetical protein